VKKILLFPYNGNAREALSVIEDINNIKPSWSVLGFIDDDPSKTDCQCGGYKVLGGRDVLKELPDVFVLAVPGRPDNYRKRKSIIDSLQVPISRFATIIHPTAANGVGCFVGKNTLIMAHVTLTADVKIGDHVVILPGSVVCHDSEVGNYTLIGSNVSVSGRVIIKNNCYIGSGVRIIQEVEIGTGALIGIGSTIIRDVPGFVTVAGSPGRKLRE
jgi:sugar O-acyltransferase (sialic acid O-acetyltransferase NeuD family)